MDTIYIKATRISSSCVHVDLETLLVLNVFEICDTDNIQLKVVIDDGGVDEPQFEVKINNLQPIGSNDVPSIANYCLWPVIVVGNSVVAGLCSVCRQIIKSSRNEGVQNLLGFREACLIACSESSIWTKFCEVDIISTVKGIFLPNSDDRVIKIPVDLTRFEHHMRQPVRIHNVYKVAREKNNDKDIKSSVPVKDLNLAHAFSEGPFITLSDVLLFPCVKVLMDYFKEETVRDCLPLTHGWFGNVAGLAYRFSDFQPLALPGFGSVGRAVKQEDIPVQSLYSSDPNRYKPQNRIYTKQSDVEKSLDIIDKSSIDVANEGKPFGFEVPFDWEGIPVDANPEGGALPKKRAARKCEQLENLAKAVYGIAKGKVYKIVDFCSGSGHLGILLAHLLPGSEVILVENKERSLLRAKERILTLDLRNVVILQCNLDYFKAKFDVGVSLHACGVATDLVMQNCIENRAHFVSCPCCYGGIHDCYHLKYPRSKQFRDGIEYADYLNLAHAADQTHKDNAKTKQGYLCMDVVDTDRKLYAESCGYEVSLGKLLPTTCTPKNNLLVGICK